MPVSTDPAKDIRAPNLEMTSDRLRPDWLMLWLYHPTWITPYTSMPQNFPAGKESLKELFGGDGNGRPLVCETPAELSSCNGARWSCHL